MYAAGTFALSFHFFFSEAIGSHKEKKNKSRSLTSEKEERNEIPRAKVIQENFSFPFSYH